MKNFRSESGGSWSFPSITMVILLEAVVFSMAGKLIEVECDGIACVSANYILSHNITDTLLHTHTCMIHSILY